MYIKENILKILKIKNILFVIFSVFNLFTCISYIISEFVYYRDDIDTALNAVSMETCINLTIISTILLIIVFISRKKIYLANFCSSYFEGDLDGYVDYESLAQVTGMSFEKIRREIKILHIYLMKNFEIESIAGKEKIVLSSKTSLCTCNHCGAEIQKRLFFTGECPYCGGSDLHAKIFTENSFFDISNNINEGINNPNYYTTKNIIAKRALFIALLVINLTFLIIIFLMTTSDISHYFDKAYQKEILLSPDSHLRSYELIKGDILDSIVYDLVFLIIFTPLAILRIKKIICINTAKNCSMFFSKCSKPFIDVRKIPNSENSRVYLKRIRSSIKRHYLTNCTLEMHDNSLKIALAKKVVKDQCPTCGAPITGAVYEDYICKYCNNKIKEVVIKK